MSESWVKQGRMGELTAGGAGRDRKAPIKRSFSASVKPETHGAIFGG